MIVTKLSGRASTERISALARLMSAGDELEGAQIDLSRINQEPQFEPLADNGLFVVKGITKARANLVIIGQNENRQEGLSKVWLNLVGRLTLATPAGIFTDPNADLIFKSGHTTTAKGNNMPEDEYYVFEGQCVLKSTSEESQ